MVHRIDAFAERSQNVGFLARHALLVVLDRIAADSYVYSDPDASLGKARRFVESFCGRADVRGFAQSA